MADTPPTYSVFVNEGSEPRLVKTFDHLGDALVEFYYQTLKPPNARVFAIGLCKRRGSSGK
jgi:hypothetical protein